METYFKKIKSKKMNQMFNGSLCLTEIIEQAKKGHSAFSKAQNGKVYFNIITWLNDKEDKYGNIMSHQLSSSKEQREKEGLIYIGNSKVLQSKPITKSDIQDDFSNIPVREIKNNEEPDDGLPF